MTGAPKAHRNDYLTREDVLELLTDNEVASVSTAESTPKLVDGEEYLDLEQLARGVLRAEGPTPVMGTVLPRKAVHDATWSKILSRLAQPVPVATHAAH